MASGPITALDAGARRVGIPQTTGPAELWATASTAERGQVFARPVDDLWSSSASRDWCGASPRPRAIQRCAAEGLKCKLCGCGCFDEPQRSALRLQGLQHRYMSPAKNTVHTIAAKQGRADELCLGSLVSLHAASLDACPPAGTLLCPQELVTAARFIATASGKLLLQ